MSAALPILLGVMLLFDPAERIDAEAAAAISEDAERINLSGATASRSREVRKSAKIRSRTTDFDRSEGVILFEGEVCIDYAEDCTMCSDKVYAFIGGSNELTRVVALGLVAITNDQRTGLCEMAVYRRKKSEIEMFGEVEKGTTARLVDGAAGAGTLEGTRLRFWLDSEQVEVDNTAITTEKKGTKFL